LIESVLSYTGNLHPQKSRNAFELIQELDKISMKLSHRIEFLSQSKSYEAIEECKVLKSLVDDIIQKKIDIAESFYNLLDNNLKVIESVESSIENSLQTVYDMQASTAGKDDESLRAEDNDFKNVIKNVDVESIEPVYCICRQISFGDMVCCANKGCKIEWFHFSCVGLRKSPDYENWFCRQCSSQGNRNDPA
jgi:hypothetical protein